MKRYRKNERHHYKVPNCPHGRQGEVGWVQATTASEQARGERWYLPGTLRCPPDCFEKTSDQ